MDDDPLKDTKQAAKILAMGEQTLAVWRCRGYPVLPYIKVGRSVRYRLSDLEAFIQSRRQTCTVAAVSPTQQPAPVMTAPRRQRQAAAAMATLAQMGVTTAD